MNEAIRLDTRVSQELDDKSRSYANKLIKLGNVKVNGTAVLKPSYMVSENDILDIADQVVPQESANFDVEVLYEDDDTLVLDKPVGMLTHSKGAFYPEQTIASYIQPKLSKEFAGTNRDGIVHRLDRATSGVILCAKTPEAEKWYKVQFADRKVQKTYLAVATGTLKHQKAVIDLPIERNPKKPQFFRVGPHGKPSVTEYETLKESTIKNKKVTLLKLTPTTGRTHQLRVHLSELDCPILGDTFYGGEKYDRLMLHASQLDITLHDKEKKTFVASTPKEFEVVNNAD